MVRHARLAAVGVAHERVGGQREAGGVEPDLGEQPGLDDGDVVGPVVLAGLEHDRRLERVDEPVPGLPGERAAARPARQRGERRALERRRRARRARARGEQDLGAHVDREHVGLRDARALGDARDLLQVLRAVRGDRRAEPLGLRADLRAIPAGPVREGVVVGRDRARDALARRLAVLAAALARRALHADPRVHGARTIRKRAPLRRATLAAPMPIQDATGLRRGLAIVEVLAEHAATGGEPLGVVRIAELVGREKSQVSRTLRTLAETGFVERDPATRGYRIGWRLFALAARAGEPRLLALALPLLRRLVGELAETAHLSVLDGAEVLTLLSEAPASSIRATGYSGRTVARRVHVVRARAAVRPRPRRPRRAARGDRARAPRPERAAHRRRAVAAARAGARARLRRGRGGVRGRSRRRRGARARLPRARRGRAQRLGPAVPARAAPRQGRRGSSPRPATSCPRRSATPPRPPSQPLRVAPVLLLEARVRAPVGVLGHVGREAARRRACGRAPRPRRGCGAGPRRSTRRGSSRPSRARRARSRPARSACR